MEVFINAEKTQVDLGSSLSHLLCNLEVQTKIGIAVALNETIIPQNQWKEIQLKLNDKIIIIEAIQGG